MSLLQNIIYLSVPIISSSISLLANVTIVYVVLYKSRKRLKVSFYYSACSTIYLVLLYYLIMVMFLPAEEYSSPTPPDYLFASALTNRMHIAALLLPWDATISCSHSPS
jgi:hypothetical protein